MHYFSKSFPAAGFVVLFSSCFLACAGVNNKRENNNFAMHELYNNNMLQLLILLFRKSRITLPLLLSIVNAYYC